jgi:glycosyltransferase involved in cell wall biosynthesis
VILAVPWGGELGAELYVAAFLAHRLASVPLVVYEMDEWRASLGEQSAWITRKLEAVFHPRVLNEARTIWAISDEMAESFRSRFGVDSRILPHCVDVERYGVSRSIGDARSKGFRLVYTGSVYGAQSDAIRNVLRAVESVGHRSYKVVIYTGQSSGELAEQGIQGRCLQIERSVPLRKIPEVLSTADALLLALSFDDEQRDVVATSMPTKVADYLASGVPVMVHAPPYAAVTRLARAEGWAEVVDTESIEQVVAALRILENDEARRRQLVDNALGVARARHDLVSRRQEFMASLQEAAASAHT